MDFTKTGLRIRAARSYAGFQGRKDFADALEISEATLVRLERGDRETKRPELLAIADATDVPMWFLDGGWEGFWSAIEQGEVQPPPGWEPPDLRGRDLRRLGDDEDQAESA